MNPQAKIEAIVAREFGWLLGCFALAVFYCALGSGDGFQPVPLFTLALYVFAAVLRIIRFYLGPGRM